jgi:hypothetical protein
MKRGGKCLDKSIKKSILKSKGKSGTAKSKVVAKVTKANSKNAAFGNESNQIPTVFAQYFDHWHITLPDDAVKTQLPGKIQLSGWYIQYKFDFNDRGKYLDFYASHRMTNDRHLRIYASGEIEGLSALLDMFFFPANDTPEQKDEIRQLNKRVRDELKQKGFE